MLGQFLCVPWNFEIFYDRVGPGPSDGRYRINSLMISAISLTFSEMMHSNMKQIAT